jgi:oligopeptide/dipeptide ABC transporter ATP-binding protein
MTPLVEVRGLTKHFTASRLWIAGDGQVTKAVEDVSFDIQEGETFGLVGESGCGKTTAGRLILRLIEPTSGKVFFEGQEVTAFSPSELREYRKKAQIIFQNPFSSLNPRRSIRAILSDGYQIYGLAKGNERQDRMEALLEKVGLDADALDRYPHQFSGGQRQRVGIARALTVDPIFIVADEPVSALDVSIQAQVLNLLRQLQRDFKFTMLLISHDLRVVYHMSDRIGVMYLGRLVELAEKQDLYGRPLHPYTRALISSAPSLEPGQLNQKAALKGEVWNKMPPPDGCVFFPRCPIAVEECERTLPQLEANEKNHWVACLRAY